MHQALPAAATPALHNVPLANQAQHLPGPSLLRNLFNTGAHNYIRFLHVAADAGFDKLSSPGLTNQSRLGLEVFGNAWYKKVAASPLVLADHLSLLIEKPLQAFNKILGSEIVLETILTTKPFWKVNGGLATKGIAIVENGLAITAGVANLALLVVAALTRLGFLATGALASVIVALTEFAIAACLASIVAGLAIVAGGLAIGLFVTTVVVAWVINLFKIAAHFISCGYISSDLLIKYTHFAAALASIKEKITGHKEHNVSGVAAPAPGSGAPRVRSSESIGGAGLPASRESFSLGGALQFGLGQPEAGSPRNGASGISLDTGAPVLVRQQPAAGSPRVDLVLDPHVPPAGACNGDVPLPNLAVLAAQASAAAPTAQPVAPETVVHGDPEALAQAINGFV